MKGLSWAKEIKKKVTVEEERGRMQFLCAYIVFAVISFVMSALNLADKFTLLTYFTFFYGVLNLINLFFNLSKNKALDYISRVAFCLGTVVMFTYFIVSGVPEGFSALWCLLLPLVAMLLYKTRWGIVISSVMLLIIVFLCWVPFGKGLLLYSYNPTFLERFPVLYIASFVIGLLFERVRSLTQKQLEKARDKYIKLSYTDKLTGLGNESAYIRTVTKMEKQIAKGNANFAIGVLDVNGVKATNDTYGHRYGCHLIVTAGKMLPSIFPESQIFHVGGDEFIVVSQNNVFDKELETVSSKLDYSKITFEGNELVLSVAFGYAVYRNGEKFNDTFQRADKQMYKNKKAIKEKYNISR